jgi:chromosome segregation ATPase
VKISKTTQWALTIGIFAILLVSASVAYGHQQAQQSYLSSAIAQANQDLVKYSTQKKDLENRRREVNSRIASAQSELRQYTESIEINEALFEAAEDADVTITGLSSSLPEEETLDGITYRVFSLTITTQGEVLPQLLIFSKKLSERFSTAVIESAKIEGGGGEAKAKIVLELKIYAYET